MMINQQEERIEILVPTHLSQSIAGRIYFKDDLINLIDLLNDRIDQINTTLKDKKSIIPPSYFSFFPRQARVPENEIILRQMRKKIRDSKGFGTLFTNIERSEYFIKIDPQERKIQQKKQEKDKRRFLRKSVIPRFYHTLHKFIGLYDENETFLEDESIKIHHESAMSPSPVKDL